MTRFIGLSILPVTTQLSWGLSVATEIVVSVPDQQLAVIDRGKVISKYPISTSKFGLGDDLAHIGMHVNITQRRIDSFIAPTETGLLARSD